MLLVAPLGALAVTVSGYVPGAVRPCVPCGKLPQPCVAAIRITSARAGHTARKTFREDAALASNSDASRTARQSSGNMRPGPSPEGPSPGASQLQKVCRAIAACVVPEALSVTTDGTTAQVIVGAALEQLRLTGPVTPLEVSTSGNTAVSPGVTVAVVALGEVGCRLTTPEVRLKLAATD